MATMTGRVNTTRVSMSIRSDQNSWAAQSLASNDVMTLQIWTRRKRNLHWNHLLNEGKLPEKYRDLENKYVRSILKLTVGKSNYKIDGNTFPCTQSQYDFLDCRSAVTQIIMTNKKLFFINQQVKSFQYHILGLEKTIKQKIILKEQ